MLIYGVIRISISAEAKQVIYASAAICFDCFMRVCKDCGFSSSQRMLKNTYYVQTLLSSLGTGRNLDPESHLYLHIKITIRGSISRFAHITRFLWGLNKLIQSSVMNELDYLLGENVSLLVLLLQILRMNGCFQN